MVGRISLRRTATLPFRTRKPVPSTVAGLRVLETETWVIALVPFYCGLCGHRWITARGTQHFPPRAVLVTAVPGTRAAVPCRAQAERQERKAALREQELPLQAAAGRLVRWERRPLALVAA